MLNKTLSSQPRNLLPLRRLLILRLSILRDEGAVNVSTDSELCKVLIAHQWACNSCFDKPLESIQKLCRPVSWLRSIIEPRHSNSLANIQQLKRLKIL